MADDSGDRTLDATSARVEEFRKQGRIARSRDASGVVATAAVIAVLAGSGGQLEGSVRRLFGATLGDLGALERLGPLSVGRGAFTELAALAGAAVFAAAGAAIVVTLAQTRLGTFGDMLSPNLGRLDPFAGLARLFSPGRASVETAVAFLRVAVVALVVGHALSKEIPLLVSLARVPLASAVPAMLGALGRVVGVATGALFVVAAIDYGQSWLSLSRQMKMTRKERDEESRNADGDPKAKARMKARARAMSKKRAMNAVKNADVVVTNPTHVAVALRYGAKDAAPIVLAKGHDEVALRIRAEARKHGVPILENRRLARALDAEVAVGRPVPAAHFAAVARILAFVYKLKGRKARRR